MRSIAIVVEAPKAQPAVQYPVAGPLEGIVYGTGMGFATGAKVTTELFGRHIGGGPVTGFVFFVFGAATISVCVVGGAVIGPFKAMPPEVARTRVRNLVATLGDPRFGSTFETALQGAVRRARPDWRIDWAGESADATLVVRLTSYGLIGRKSFEPELALGMTAKTWWRAGGVEHRADFVHMGPNRPMMYWLDHPEELRSEVHKACDRLATAIAEERTLVEVAP